MPNSIQVFQNEEFKLQVTPDGDSFTVQAPGLARALGFHEARDMVRVLPEEEKRRVRTSPEQVGDSSDPLDQQVWSVTEPGFYRAIGQRQTARIKNAAVREQVARFQNWVYREVLPSIRKTGSYSVVPQTYAQALRAAADAAEAQERAELEAARLSEELSVAAPKADKWQQYMNSDGLIGMTELAAILGISAVALTKKLVEKEIFRVMERDGKRSRTPRAKYLHNGMFEAKIEVHNGHTVHVNYAHPSGADHVMDIFQHPLARIGK